MKKVSSFHASTITFATSKTSTHCSKLSGVLRVTLFSQRRGIWNDIWLLVVIVLNIYTQRMFKNCEKRFLKRWMHSISHIEMSKNCSRTWQYFTLSPNCVKKNSYKQTETTTWIRKHVPISVSISPTLIPEHIFLCNDNPHHLISSFITTLEGLATQSKTQMKLNFIEVETAIKIKLCAILEQLNQRRKPAERVSNFAVDCMVVEEEKDLSTQFLQMQKNQLIDLQEQFERYCNVLPVSGLKSAKQDINLIKSLLLPNFVNDRDIGPTVIKEAKQFVSFTFGNIQLLDIMNFLGRATSLDSFLKAY